MHGIDHVRLFDHGSVDKGLAEVEPWIQSGFISVQESLGEQGTESSRQNKDRSDRALFDKVCR